MTNDSSLQSGSKVEIAIVELQRNVYVHAFCHSEEGSRLEIQSYRVFTVPNLETQARSLCDKGNNQLRVIGMFSSGATSY
jgi:anti-sigma regulatory factor (Ser/Thr protein kinase)